MAVKSVFRFVDYRIIAHPDSEPTYAAQCLNPDCTWTLAPTADGEQADVDCMTHRADTGHGIFSRSYQQVAVVVPAR
ncbi:hypothetical protein ACFQ8W_00125 [Streptomyces sp. NPDC056508]|uniref:DUF7848 domain-containing protein n=1 Tax=Streptomyces sp. NPDC056508 TaxID=3345845 RepID=UPI00369AD57C